MENYICLFDNGLEISFYSQVKVDSIISELVFNTSMTGYQEIFTDPSYAQQTVVMTYPLIGNYNLNSLVSQSQAAKISCLIAKEAEDCVVNYLNSHNIPVITGLDTRDLTQKIRDGKVKKLGIWKASEFSREKSSELIKEFEINTQDCILASCVAKDVIIPGENSAKSNILLIDCGVKQGIIDNLAKFGNIFIVPYSANILECIQKYSINRIIISNGPGNPADLADLIAQIKDLIGEIPIYGICLGHQIICLALGCRVEKMVFGHRGSNHPVIDTETNRVFLISQNHSYSVVTESIPNGVKAKYVNLNDETVEGIISEKFLIKTAQFHPESCPGTDDANFIFHEWFGESNE